MMVPAHAHQYDVHPAGEHGHDELHGHPDVTLYGTLRYGVTLVDNGKSGSDTEVGLGDAYTSSFGVKGTTPVGEGMTGGFQIERGIGDSALTARHHNVYLSGAFRNGQARPAE